MTYQQLGPSDLPLRDHAWAQPYPTQPAKAAALRPLARRVAQTALDHRGWTRVRGGGGLLFTAPPDLVQPPLVAEASIELYSGPSGGLRFVPLIRLRHEQAEALTLQMPEQALPDVSRLLLDLGRAPDFARGVRSDEWRMLAATAVEPTIEEIMRVIDGPLQQWLTTEVRDIDVLLDLATAPWPPGIKRRHGNTGRPTAILALLHNRPDVARAVVRERLPELAGDSPVAVALFERELSKQWLNYGTPQSS